MTCKDIGVSYCYLLIVRKQEGEVRHQDSGHPSLRGWTKCLIANDSQTCLQQMDQDGFRRAGNKEVGGMRVLAVAKAS